MDIYGADLNGINGELIRFRVLGERHATGVAILGDARKVTAKGTRERCFSAIRLLDGFAQVGDDLRYLIDLTPVEATVRSPGIDLPLAITILRATVMQSLTDLRTEFEACEAELNKEDDSAAPSERRERARHNYLAKAEALRQQIDVVQRYQSALGSNAGNYLLVGKLDITTGALDSPRDGMLGLIAAGASSPGMKVLVPEDAEAHGAIVAAAHPLARMTVIKVRDLAEAWGVILGTVPARPCRLDQRRLKAKPIAPDAAIPDLHDIRGNSRAKLALEVALAGRHSLLLVGPPGQGKSMLALAATKLLPDLEQHEILEVNKIYSARGELQDNELVLRRPYQEATNTITEAALFGCVVAGGMIRPGLISASHLGILLFDEVNLVRASTLDRLRDPWSKGYSEIQRGNAPSVRMPSRFQFIGAMNPCKCGWQYHHRCATCGDMLAGGQPCQRHPQADRTAVCSCSPREINRFKSRLSGPFCDRISMVCLVSQYDQERSWHSGQASSTVKSRIASAWRRQQTRFAQPGFQHIGSNAAMGNPAEIKRCGAIDGTTERRLAGLLREAGLEVHTIRKLNQLLGIARTVADLADAEVISDEHLSLALAVSGIKEGLLD